MNDNRDNVFFVKNIDAFIEPLISVIKNQAKQSLNLEKGKMGFVVFFYFCFRITSNNEYEKIANDLIDEIWGKISLETSFSDLTGIGIGVEYLIQNNFLEGDSDVILQEIDSLLEKTLLFRQIKSIGFEKGICRLGYYYYLRLKEKTENNDNLQTLKNKLNLIRIVDWLEDTIPYSTNQEIYDVYLLLVQIQSLNIINVKTNDLIKQCFSKLCFNEPIYNNYELLGIPALKIIQPWM